MLQLQVDAVAVAAVVVVDAVETPADAATMALPARSAEAMRTTSVTTTSQLWVRRLMAPRWWISGPTHFVLDAAQYFFLHLW